MEGVPFENDLVALRFRKKKFTGIFRDNKVTTALPDMWTVANWRQVS